MQRLDILERKQDILNWIEEGKSKAYISKQLSCKPETLNSYLKKMGIEYAGRQDWNKGNTNSHYVNALEYMKKDNARSSILLYKLIRDGIKEGKCENCGLSTWLDNTIPLELHHKDNNHYNNELSNLQILCPNCHAKTHGNLGITTGLYSELQKQENQERQVKYKEKTQIICPICNKNLMLSSSTMCKECAAKARRVTNRPDRNTLKQLIRTTSFMQIGKKYKVTDNAIRKWCDNYNLPRTVAEIKKYTDEEWEKI